MSSRASWKRQLPPIQHSHQITQNPRSLTPSMTASTRQTDPRRASPLRFNCFTLLLDISWIAWRAIKLFPVTSIVKLRNTWKPHRRFMNLKRNAEKFWHRFFVLSLRSTYKRLWMRTKWIRTVSWKRWKICYSSSFFFKKIKSNSETEVRTQWPKLACLQAVVGLSPGYAKSSVLRPDCSFVCSLV